MSNPGIGIKECPWHGEYNADAEDSPCPSCEDYDEFDGEGGYECAECGSTYHPTSECPIVRLVP